MSMSTTELKSSAGSRAYSPLHCPGELAENVHDHLCLTCDLLALLFLKHRVYYIWAVVEREINHRPHSNMHSLTVAIASMLASIKWTTWFLHVATCEAASRSFLSVRAFSGFRNLKNVYTFWGKYRDQAEKNRVLVGLELFSTLQTLAHRRDVASLSMLCYYYHEKCTGELHLLVPLCLAFMVKTRHAVYLVANYLHSLH